MTEAIVIIGEIATIGAIEIIEEIEIIEGVMMVIVEAVTEGNFGSLLTQVASRACSLRGTGSFLPGTSLP